MRLVLLISIVLTLLLPPKNFGEENELVDKVKNSIEKGILFFHSLNSNGGYVYYYLLDNTKRWGEELADKNTIEVQPPGTPAVGLSFLNAYKTLGNPLFLEFAKETAYALIKGQNKYGGWDHTINFDDLAENSRVSFDDNQTQSSIRFLMAMDQVTDDEKISSAVISALDMMMESQFPNGAWPHLYPKQDNYHDLATFNDATINNCIQVMIDAFKYYENDKYLESIKKAGDFILISQVEAPQSGWAQQYDEDLNPAWARSYEPPSVSALVTFNNINSLIDIYLITGNEKYLEPIPPAFKWLKSIKLDNGKYPRFVELGTNKPLYYDRDRKRVNSLEELSIERRMVYGYEQNLDYEWSQINTKFEEVKKVGREEYLKVHSNHEIEIPSDRRYSNLEKEVIRILSSQDSLGRWINYKDKYRDKKRGKRWSGDFAFQDRISSEVFNYNINTLCKYLRLKDDSN